MAESAQDIVFKFLAAEERLVKELNDSEDWVDEMKAFLLKTFELKLITKSQKWKPIAEELWRFLLLSEFVFDLPGELPEQLKTVPIAERSTEPLIYEICDQLRDNRRTRSNYIDHAQDIAGQLELKTIVGELDDFGDRDTFDFEERAFLISYADAVRNEEFDKARHIEETHRNSIWVTETSAVSEWKLVDQAFSLIRTIEDQTRNQPNPPNTMEELVECYTSKLTKIDQLHRGLLQLEEDLYERPDNLIRLIEVATRKYEDLTGSYAKKFTENLSLNNWPLNSQKTNNEVFSKFVKPSIKVARKLPTSLSIHSDTNWPWN